MKYPKVLEQRLDVSARGAYGVKTAMNGLVHISV